ncbi:MAG: hypothetical protein NVS1B11_06440 [Terriglobales bacterium]
MNTKNNLIAAGARIVGSHKRYIIWFYLLNLVFGLAAASSFRINAHNILDHSFYSDKLLYGFDVVALLEMLARPEMGSPATSTSTALSFSVLFLLVTMFLLPGVLKGYESERRIPREEFFRTCGLNLWRSVRLFFFYLIIAGLISGVLFAAQNAIVKGADKSSYERLPFILEISCLLVIFQVVTAIRIAFDLAQTDVVVRDQSAVRRSIAAAFRDTRRNLWQLLGSYVVIALFCAAVIAAGALIWIKLMPPASIVGAFLLAQAILLFTLSARFWQRACAVAFYTQQRLTPVFEAPAIQFSESPLAQEGGGI